MGPQTAASALVMAQTDVYNGRATPVLFSLTTTVYDATGAAVGAATSSANLSAGGWTRVYQQVSLGASGPVHLWNTESSYLHTVGSALAVGGAAVDALTASIGVRDAVWTPNTGFMLNGFKVPAQGFSNHQDFGGVGTAVPDRINEFRVTSLRSLGANFWRTAHNPVNPELLDYCDQHGVRCRGPRPRTTSAPPP